MAFLGGETIRMRNGSFLASLSVLMSGYLYLRGVCVDVILFDSSSWDQKCLPHELLFRVQIRWHRGMSSRCYVQGVIGSGACGANGWVLCSEWY